MDKGNYKVEWNLVNQSGSKVKPGVYFAGLTNSGYSKSTKIAVR
jgi:hypothetical protein